MQTKIKLIIVTVLLLSVFTVILLNKKTITYNFADKNTVATVLTKDQMILHNQIPFLGKSFVGFKEALAFKESRGDYNCVNTLGYLGKYQFGKTTLQRFKIHNTRGFLKDAALQEDAFIALCSVNKWILRKDIKRKVGKKINGILITESGILAASHLAGAGNVKKYLRSNGLNNFGDAYGSNIEYYLNKFAGYDTSFIIADKNARI
ncbi:MAG: peptidoglycan-binding protein LysM [Flavobacteriaceae bacterium]|nr:peptidoglycan-binding protein LysM [Flavobacteriaceae bacterium]